jgi:hypothetical protein
LNSKGHGGQVKVYDEGRLCAAGHIAREIINQNLARPDLAHKFKHIDLVIHFQASRMKFTVTFKDGNVDIRDGHAGRPGVRVRAPLSAYLDFVLRRIPWAELFRLRVFVFGNYFKLWKALPLLVHHEPIPPELLEGG